MLGPALEKASALYAPSRTRFFKLARRHNLVTVGRRVGADLETPVSAFLKLAGGREPYAFLLESAEGGKSWGRYSLIGTRPAMVMRYGDGCLQVERHPVGGPVQLESLPGCDPVEELFSAMDACRPDPQEELPFCGGAVGYLGFGILPFLDRVTLKAERALPLPDMFFMFTRSVLVFDHLLSSIHVMVNVMVPEGATTIELNDLYDGALAEVERTAEELRRPVNSGRGSETYYLDPNGDFDGVASDLDRQTFEDRVRRAQEHIRAGDAYQIVLSQGFRRDFHGDPFDVYRALRGINPSPYMFYLRCGDFSLAGSSPEPLVTRRGRQALIRPIAGTRPRGGERDEAELERELLADPKERAEHVMLVDLARNDLGRVCKPGTVSVSRMMEVERYSHVMHMVSEVTGELEDGVDDAALLRASFPAGTVSGAPKLRACELLDSLEGEARGPYGGAVGYAGYGADLDTCIAIRMAVFCDGQAHVRAGAGIVAASDPASEYEETRSKARALLRAIRMAGGAAL
ncbi:MAG: anthranilate synthase component I family protein [Candidatus Geothermincolia bacterium]